MERCDVLIVGGGPAGSSCAWQLRQSGLDVLVWDAREFPRDKVCAGWITPQVLEALEVDVGDYASRRVFQPIRAFRIGRMGDGEIVVEYDTLASYGIRRCEFDAYLLGRSQARLRLGEPVHRIRREAGDWIVNGTVRARVVVGAGGHFCPVARFLGARLGAGEPIVAAEEIEFELPAVHREQCRTAGETPELYFTRDLKGYGWIFRKGNFLNVGLGRQDSRRLSHHLDSFVGFLAQRGRLPPGLPSRWHGHAYLLHGNSSRPRCRDAALLVGDAAGLAYERSGEGIRPAVESGLLAGQVLRAADGRYDREQLAPYEQLLDQRFGTSARQGDLSRHVPEGAACWVAGRMLKMPWFARNVVLDRWFLHSHLPALRETMVYEPRVERTSGLQAVRP